MWIMQMTVQKRTSKMSLNSSCTCEKRVYDPETMEDICQSCGRAFQAGHNPFEPKPRPVKTDTIMSERDCNGVQISAETKRSFRVADSIMSKNRVHAFRTMTAMIKLTRSTGEQLGLPPKVIGRATELVEKCNNSKICFLKHDRVRAIVAVCLYLATKESGVPRNFLQYADAVGIGRRTFHKFHVEIEKLLGGIRPIGPDDYRIAISHVCNVLNLGKIERKALELFDRTGANICMGKKHDSIAAGYVYMACVLAKEDIYLLQKEIAAAARISAVSLRKSAKLIQHELGIKEDDRKKSPAEL